MDRPRLLDSTLREGEQTPGVLFTAADKLAIAHELDAFGVDYIEVGHPAVTADIAHAAREVCHAGLQAETVVHARAVRGDIDLALRCDADWVGIFYAVRDEALRERFHRDLASVIEQIRDVVGYAKAHGLKVRYTPEDTVRSPWPNVRAAATAAVEAGADRISIADTTGCMTPTRMADAVHRMRSIVDVPLHVHCHNDLGLAAANALAAYEAGASVIDVAVNGLGERTGIADLAQVATAVRVAYGIERPWDLARLPALSRLVAERSGIPVGAQTPVTGGNAFCHNAGLHVAAVFHDPQHYESVPAALVGRTRSVCVDRFAGVATLRYKARELGLDPDDATLIRVLRRIKDDERNVVPDLELRALLSSRRAPASIASSGVSAVARPAPA